MQMNDKNKQSLARKLAVRVSTVLVVAFMLLLTVTVVSITRDVKEEAQNYAMAMVGIYSDILVYEASQRDEPIDLSSTDHLKTFGDYMCQWYRLDYIYSFVPDVENGTVTFLSVSRNKDKFGDLSEDHMVGVTKEYRMSPDEVKAWNDSTVYAFAKPDWFVRKSSDVMLRFTDAYGNKAMVGAMVSTDIMHRNLLQGSHLAAFILLLIAGLVALLLYLLIRHMVTDPARRISKAMTEYISEGRKSAVKLEIDGGDEFSMIAGSFNHMTEEMDKYIEDIARLGREQERQQAEVDIASSIQMGILPYGRASFGNCGIKAVMKPAKYIGGDLYDYLELDASHTMIAVADVSGKGLPSALLMAVALTLFRQFARMGYSPAGILKNVNDTFSEENPEMMFVTAFVGIYDSDNDTLTYANAGHNPPYLMHEGLKVLDGSAGTPLGLFQGEEYKDIVVKMEKEDSVFLYTDGVNEAVNKSGEFFGTGRLEEALVKAAATPERFYVETVEEALRDFVGDADQNDDITMLAIRARKNPVLELDYDVKDFSSIRDRILASGLPKPLVMDLCVAAEEIFVNICSYAFDGPAPAGEKIRFFFEYSSKVVMRFSDGGKRFDPRVNLPDTDEYDIDTAVGGLGRLIAFTVADSVDYEYKDGRNLLTIVKSIKN